jgi:hypothetical protein
MRLLIAAVIIALTTLPSLAQQSNQTRRNSSGFTVQPDPVKPYVDEKAYSSAIKNMGSTNETYDPWRSVREPAAKSDEPASKPKTKTTAKKPPQ